MQYLYLDTPCALRAYCEHAATKSAVAVDTEFVRTRTFYPQLGLVQLFDGEQAALVDVIAIDDCSSLVSLLTNPNVIKVLHAPSEDLEAFHYALGIYPSPMFDTQTAAQLLGIGNTMGYGRMVEALLSVSLEKGESRTDWLRRPLTAEQLSYAADDVIYLLPCYDKITEQLSPKQAQIVHDEMALLIDRKSAVMPAEFAYLGFKNTWKLAPRNLYVLKELAAWRLRYAREHDVTVNFVTRELGLFEIARDLPKHKGALFQMDLLAPQEARKHHVVFLDIVHKALTLSDDTLPQRLPRLTDRNGFKKLSAEIKAQCQPLADELGLDIAFVASKRQISQIISYHWSAMDETRAQGLTPELMCYWRGEALTDKLLPLLSKS